MKGNLAAIERSLDSGDLETAAALAEAAIANGGQEPLMFNLAGWKAEREGLLAKSEAILRHALSLYPRDATLHLALGITLRSIGQLREAVEAFDTALALDPGYATAWQERGSTFEKGGALNDAIADFRQAVMLDPTDPAVLATLAAALARQGELAETRIYAERALAIDPSSIQARSALAHAALEERRYADAVVLMQPIEQDGDDASEVMIGAHTLLGDAYQGVGRYDDAYRSYERAQAIFQSFHEARAGKDRLDPQVLADRIATSFAAADETRWNGSVGISGPARTHVFLTGYPRSGTTLVENILATLPTAIAIEERPTLADVEPAFLNDPDGLDRFAALADPDLDRLRAHYWERAERAAGENLTDRLFVDMDPFKSLRLPVIARLFPKAKIILMRRDPRDVVWSCFHTNFAYNAGTMAYTTLERTARHYARTWEIIEAARARLSLDCFDLRYDALVREFDATTQALCAWLDVGWDERLRQFDKTAQRRGVTTASMGQVRKGLYDGSGGWRRYSRQIATVEPILAPWIERFESTA